MYFLGSTTVLLVLYLLGETIDCGSPANNTGKEKSIFNHCLAGKYHKSAPGPEAALYDFCSPWKNRSCCTHDISERIHDLTLHRFNYSHCQPLSESCRQYFIKDLCFYECSPNIGPWVEKVEGLEIRKEQFKNVPLCKTDCDDWFSACKNDLVCSRNWVKDGNKCTEESYCLTIENTYRTAKYFCEEIWDYSWRYTPDDEPCMKMWFDPSQGNPNDAVTLANIEERRTDGSGSTEGILLVFLFIVLITSIGFILIRKDCLFRRK